MTTNHRRCLQWNWFLLLSHCLWRVTHALTCGDSIVGSVSVNQEGSFSAPNFPHSYPREDSFYQCTYTLTNSNATDFIRLVFDDFHLNDQGNVAFQNGVSDYLQIDFQNGRTPLNHVGINRPAAIMSPGSSLVVTLGVQADGPRAFSGFRTFSAHYRFIGRQEKEEMESIFSDTRTVIPQVSLEQGILAYTIPSLGSNSFSGGIDIDIIWYIQAEPHLNILFIIEEFRKTESGDISTLEIRDGLTSQAPPLYFARTAQAGYHIQSTHEKLYVRWKGSTSAGASFHAQFSFYIQAGPGMLCPSNYFTCENGHCVLLQLVCNSRDNCGDSSDEDRTSRCQVPSRGTLPCHPSPCMQGGTCIAFGSQFICHCPERFHGELCERRKRHTTVSPTCSIVCLNGGVCLNGACQCLDGYFGDLCEFRNSSGTDFTDLQHTSIMIGAFVGAVCLLSVCWLIAMARKRYQEEPPQGHLTRIVSIHTPEEVGLRRNTTVIGEQDIPPAYNIACRRDSRRGSLPKRYRPSIDSMGPLSPPPSYEIVTGELETLENEYDPSQFTIPEAVEERNLPDVVNSDQPPCQPASNASQENPQEEQQDPEAEDQRQTAVPPRVSRDTVV
ncbi:uncharacterized protein [Diadema setosum]|uniref:uncharacterized protein n=1 Tax=Diadema setosum TaxID=31175 RepID=UPI003B3ADD47